MRPLPKGAARTALTEQLADLTKGDISLSQAAAVLGGAVDESLKQAIAGIFTQVIGHEAIVEREARKLFWRHFEYNLWSLVTSLRASNQLDKIK